MFDHHARNQVLERLYGRIGIKHKILPVQTHARAHRKQHWSDTFDAVFILFGLELRGQTYRNIGGGNSTLPNTVHRNLNIWANLAELAAKHLTDSLTQTQKNDHTGYGYHNSCHGERGPYRTAAQPTEGQFEQVSCIHQVNSKRKYGGKGVPKVPERPARGRVGG